MAGESAPAPSAQARAGHRPVGRGPEGSRPTGAYRSPQSPSNLSGLLVKIVLLALVNGVVLYGLPTMIDHRDWGFVVVSIVALLSIDAIYLSRRMIAGKYLVPGTIFLLIFAVYPVFYTVYNSFTNYGTGNIISKSQAVEQIQRNSVVASTDAIRFELQVLAKADTGGELAFLLTDTDGKHSLGTKDGLTALQDSQIIQQGSRSTVDGYVALNLGAANSRKDEISAFRVTSERGEIQNDGFTKAFAKTQGLRYDAASNTIISNIDGTVYREVDGAFASDAGVRLNPGWRAVIGTANYERINSADIRGPFFRVFVWTFVFAMGSVLLTFTLGLFLALVFNNERMRARRFYRLAMIVPYALPSFMTALVWRGMLNQRFGIVNRMFGANLAWLDGQWLPYASILLVNLWLGFPYMFLVSTGALQGIPSDLTEAAFVDGATGYRAFQKVTLPLLLIAVSPLLIASFAFNFNNFNIIYLLTEGKPPIPRSDAGRTDILISYTYKLAFGGGRGADYGFASAISVIIFILVAGMSAFGFRYTKAFEEVK
jgi:arabinogalactan oligomer/maltooligosaccharide transport system permease protein